MTDYIKTSNGNYRPMSQREKNQRTKFCTRGAIGGIAAMLTIGSCAIGPEYVGKIPKVNQFLEEQQEKSIQRGFNKVAPYVTNTGQICVTNDLGLNTYVNQIASTPEAQKLLGKYFEKEDLKVYLKRINGINPENPYTYGCIKGPIAWKTK